MITLTAQMIDRSTITATVRDDGTFEYQSAFVLQIDGFYFPGMTINHTTPAASAVMEGTALVVRLGSTTDPVLPYGQDFQKFELDTFSRLGRECFTEDHTTTTHCRSVVSADLTVVNPQPVPIPGWAGFVTIALIVGVGVGVAKRRAV